MMYTPPRPRMDTDRYLPGPSPWVNVPNGWRKAKARGRTPSHLVRVLQAQVKDYVKGKRREGMLQAWAEASDEVKRAVITLIPSMLRRFRRAFKEHINPGEGGDHISFKPRSSLAPYLGELLDIVPDPVTPNFRPLHGLLALVLQHHPHLKPLLSRPVDCPIRLQEIAAAQNQGRPMDECHGRAGCYMISWLDTIGQWWYYIGLAGDVERRAREHLGGEQPASADMGERMAAAQTSDGQLRMTAVFFLPNHLPLELLCCVETLLLVATGGKTSCCINHVICTLYQAGGRSISVHSTVACYFLLHDCLQRSVREERYDVPQRPQRYMLSDEPGQRHESFRFFANLFRDCIAASGTYSTRPDLFALRFFQALSSYRIDPVLRTLYRHWPLNRFGYKIYQRRIATTYRPDPFLQLSRELDVDLSGGPGDEPVAKMWKQKVDGAKKGWREADGEAGGDPMAFMGDDDTAEGLEVPRTLAKGPRTMHPSPEEHEQHRQIAASCAAEADQRIAAAKQRLNLKGDDPFDGDYTIIPIDANEIMRKDLAGERADQPVDVEMGGPGEALEELGDEDNEEEGLAYNGDDGDDEEDDEYAESEEGEGEE